MISVSCWPNLIPFSFCCPFKRWEALEFSPLAWTSIHPSVNRGYFNFVLMWKLWLWTLNTKLSKSCTGWNVKLLMLSNSFRHPADSLNVVVIILDVLITFKGLIRAIVISKHFIGSRASFFYVPLEISFLNWRLQSQEKNMFSAFCSCWLAYFDKVIFIHCCSVCADRCQSLLGRTGSIPHHQHQIHPVLPS